MALDNAVSKITQQYDYINAQGIKLSSRISTEIEYLLEKNNTSFQDLNDSALDIEELQQAIYNPLSNTMELLGCSGAYVILDATVNTAASNAESSRCGLYLRRTSVNDFDSVNFYTVLFRGMKEVARKNKLELHNRWNMEFDVENFPYYNEIRQKKPVRAADSYLWSKKETLTGTWENAMYLIVPIIGDSEEFYGICGIEISELYFRHGYPSSDSKFGTFVTVLAPRDQQTLYLAEGLCGAENRGKFIEDTFDIKEDKNFNYYTHEDRQYIGISQDIELSGSAADDTNWTVTVLLPASKFHTYVAKRKAIAGTVFVVLLALLIMMAAFLSRRYVRPITQQIQKIQNGNLAHDAQTGLSEIDELMNFLKTQKQSTSPKDNHIPEGIEEIFDNFIERAKTLTNAEYNILKFYIEGYQIMEIPNLAFISMSTVRRHNRSIYEKLKVSSRDELMLYIDLLRRCGRIDELDRNAKK